MGQPQDNIVLSPEQAALTKEQFRKMRHDINNHLAVIQASVELIRRKPEMAERLLDSVASKPPAITQCIKSFSEVLEKLLQPNT